VRRIVEDLSLLREFSLGSLLGRHLKLPIAFHFPEHQKILILMKVKI